MSIDQRGILNPVEDGFEIKIANEDAIYMLKKIVDKVGFTRKKLSSKPIITVTDFEKVVLMLAFEKAFEALEQHKEPKKEKVNEPPKVSRQAEIYVEPAQRGICEKKLVIKYPPYENGVLPPDVSFPIINNSLSAEFLTALFSLLNNNIPVLYLGVLIKGCSHNESK